MLMRQLLKALGVNITPEELEKTKSVVVEVISQVPAYIAELEQFRRETAVSLATLAQAVDTAIATLETLVAAMGDTRAAGPPTPGFYDIAPVVLNGGMQSE